MSVEGGEEEGRREGGRERRREGGREGGRKGGREEGREGGRERRREGGREGGWGGRGGGSELSQLHCICSKSALPPIEPSLTTILHSANRCTVHHCALSSTNSLPHIHVYVLLHVLYIASPMGTLLGGTSIT